MSDFALRARWVLPISSPPIDSGVVSVVGGRIISVGNQVPTELPIQDLGDVILMPGFVNAHTHLEFSDLESPLGKQGSDLPNWIRLVIANRKQSNVAQASIQSGHMESIRAGVTTIGDISTSPWFPDRQGILPDQVTFQEVIGFSAARMNSVFDDAKHRVESSSSVGQSGISPHAPYTVHPELVTKLVELASAKNLPVAMHLAESREELELLQKNRGPFRELLEERSMWDGEVFADGRQPLQYIQQLADAPRALVIHGNYLEREEFEFIAQNAQMTVVYCPRTHTYFGHDPYPLEEMLARGVRMALGTDSRASNPDLNMLSELRFLKKMFPVLSPKSILELGTIAGARALGLEKQVGSLEGGKIANLTAIPCETNSQDPVEAMLAGEQVSQFTWIHGHRFGS